MLSDTDCNGRYTQSTIALAMRLHHFRKPPLFPDASMWHVARTLQKGLWGLRPWTAGLEEPEPLPHIIIFWFRYCCTGRLIFGLSPVSERSLSPSQQSLKSARHLHHLATVTFGALSERVTAHSRICAALSISRQRSRHIHLWWLQDLPRSFPALSEVESSLNAALQRFQAPHNAIDTAGCQKVNYMLQSAPHKRRKYSNCLSPSWPNTGSTTHRAESCSSCCTQGHIANGKSHSLFWCFSLHIQISGIYRMSKLFHGHQTPEIGSFWRPVWFNLRWVRIIMQAFFEAFFNFRHISVSGKELGINFWGHFVQMLQRVL